MQMAQPTMANKQIITDTSALYALVDRRDQNHFTAANFIRQHTVPNSLVISNHVFDETMTLVRMRLGVDVAVQLGLRLRNSRFVEMFTFGTGEEMATWQVFCKYRDKEWSYTDCACFAIAQQRKTDQVFSFDHHFTQMGLQMVA